jgi:protein gp37
MSDKSLISWCDATWNPTQGCTKVSAGCAHCYAERWSKRFRKSFDLRLVPEALGLPLRWKKPRRVFVDSMSDLFHPEVPFEFIAGVFGVMAECPQHQFQLLTKRPERMREWYRWLEGTIDPIVAQYARDGMRQRPRGQWYAMQTIGWADNYLKREVSERDEESPPAISWPLPNVWLGVSVENQETADERIPILLDAPAAHRFVSAEPLLGPIDLSEYLPGDQWWTSDHPMEAPTNWVIVGGESGPGARPCDVAWIRSIVGQSRSAGVPCHVKQLGAHSHWDADGYDCDDGPVCVDCEHDGESRFDTSDRSGRDPSEWPTDLRMQQFPEDLCPAK